MKRLKIYFDTSVIGFLDNHLAPEKMADTQKLWEMVKDGVYDVYLSEVTIAELDECFDPKKTSLFEYLGQIEYTLIETDEKTTAVAQRFIDLGVLSQKWFDDCQHIAAAIVGGCDVIVSWNFKHIVNHNTVIGVKAVTALEGFPELLIYTPSVLIGGDEDDT